MSPLTEAVLVSLHKRGVGDPETERHVELWRRAGAPDLPKVGDGTSLGALLRRAREAAGCNQRVVGSHLKVGQMQVSRWECDEAIPDAGELGALLEFYAVPGEVREEALRLAAARHRERKGA